MKGIHLHRIGSDPEFAFTKVQEYDHTLVPANMVISNNKALALASFIGTDNHAATAELRPPPNHNIKGQVLAVASAVQSVDEFLRGNPAFADVRMIASPSVANEPLGGHIHLSFFFEDKPYREILDMGMNYTTKFVSSTWNMPLPNIAGDTRINELVESFRNRVAKGLIPTPYRVTDVLNYLLLPLEFWLQLWGSRTKRNAKYGMAAETQIRWNASPQPKIDTFKDWAYLHYEYRTPSTWLCHPWMAYLYFAMVKLIAVNWKLVTDQLAGHKHHATQVYDLSGPEPANEAARQLFEQRFEKLRPYLRWTADTKDIPKALDYALKYRNQWVDPYRGVMVDAWKEVLG